MSLTLRKKLAAVLGAGVFLCTLPSASGMRDLFLSDQDQVDADLRGLEEAMAQQAGNRAELCGHFLLNHPSSFSEVERILDTIDVSAVFSVLEEALGTFEEDAQTVITKVDDVWELARQQEQGIKEVCERVETLNPLLERLSSGNEFYEKVAHLEKENKEKDVLIEKMDDQIKQMTVDVEKQQAEHAQKVKNLEKKAVGQLLENIKLHQQLQQVGQKAAETEVVLKGNQEGIESVNRALRELESREQKAEGVGQDSDDLTPEQFQSERTKGAHNEGGVSNLESFSRSSGNQKTEFFSSEDDSTRPNKLPWVLSGSDRDKGDSGEEDRQEDQFDKEKKSSSDKVISNGKNEENFGPSSIQHQEQQPIINQNRSNQEDENLVSDANQEESPNTQNCGGKVDGEFNLSTSQVQGETLTNNQNQDEGFFLEEEEKIGEGGHVRGSGQHPEGGSLKNQNDEDPTLVKDDDNDDDKVQDEKQPEEEENEDVVDDQELNQESEQEHPQKPESENHSSSLLRDEEDDEDFSPQEIQRILGQWKESSDGNLDESLSIVFGDSSGNDMNQLMGADEPQALETLEAFRKAAGQGLNGESSSLYRVAAVVCALEGLLSESEQAALVQLIPEQEETAWVTVAKEVIARRKEKNTDFFVEEAEA